MADITPPAGLHFARACGYWRTDGRSPISSLLGNPDLSPERTGWPIKVSLCGFSVTISSYSLRPYSDFNHSNCWRHKIVVHRICITNISRDHRTLTRAVWLPAKVCNRRLGLWPRLYIVPVCFRWGCICGQLWRYINEPYLTFLYYFITFLSRSIVKYCLLLTGFNTIVLIRW